MERYGASSGLLPSAPDWQKRADVQSWMSFAEGTLSAFALAPRPRQSELIEIFCNQCFTVSLSLTAAGSLKTSRRFRRASSTSFVRSSSRLSTSFEADRKANQLPTFKTTLTISRQLCRPTRRGTARQTARALSWVSSWLQPTLPRHLSLMSENIVSVGESLTVADIQMGQPPSSSFNSILHVAQVTTHG